MKMEEKTIFLKVMIISIIFGAIAGGITTYSILKTAESTEEDYIKEFYNVENAVHVSPHSIRKEMAKGESKFILVDLRSQEEYEEEHIATAVSIPAYKDKDHSDYGAVERITNSFRDLHEANPDKDIIVYCYSIPCMSGRKVGKILADEGIYVKHLGIGWNEWRYYWELWNHQHEWNITDVTDYTATGSEPGSVKGINKSEICAIEGGLGC